MNEDFSIEDWIECTIKRELAGYLVSVDASGQDVKVVLCNAEGKQYTPRMVFEKKKIKTQQDLIAKIRTIKIHASITEGFNAPQSWENGE